MAKKQPNTNETSGAAALPRAAKTSAPRVKAAQHSKAVSADPVAVSIGSEQASADNAQTATERIAYSYWEARGFQGGNALEDWVRAEHEYRQRAAATRL